MMANDQHTSAAGPGKALRQARHDSKLSVEEVALQLHLAPRQIEALENDDYANLPQPTYVRGYLRNYAQLLGLAVEPLMEAYNRAHPAPAPASVMPVATAASETRSGDGHIKLISFLVAALVIGFAAAWWQGREPSAPRDTGSSSVTVQTEPPPGSEPPIALGAAPEPPSTATPSTEPAPTEARPQAEPKPEAKKEAPAPVAPRRDIGAPIDAPAPAGPLPAGHARLVLRAAQDSWAEVRDAQGGRLLYETVPAGRMVSVEGAAPLSVFLGNVAGVKVEANGKEFDAQRYKRGVIARFSIPRAQTAPSAPATQAPPAAPAPHASVRPHKPAPVTAAPPAPVAPVAPTTSETSPNPTAPTPAPGTPPPPENVSPPAQ